MTVELLREFEFFNLVESESLCAQMDELEKEREVEEGNEFFSCGGNGGVWFASLFTAEEMEVVAMFFSCVFLSLSSVCFCVSKVVGEGKTLFEFNFLNAREVECPKYKYI